MKKKVFFKKAIPVIATLAILATAMTPLAVFAYAEDAILYLKDISSEITGDVSWNGCQDGDGNEKADDSAIKIGDVNYYKGFKADSDGRAIELTIPVGYNIFETQIGICGHVNGRYDWYDNEDYTDIFVNGEKVYTTGFMPRGRIYEITLEVNEGDTMRMEFGGGAPFGHICVADPVLKNGEFKAVTQPYYLWDNRSEMHGDADKISWNGCQEKPKDEDDTDKAYDGAVKLDGINYHSGFKIDNIYTVTITVPEGYNRFIAKAGICNHVNNTGDWYEENGEINLYIGDATDPIYSTGAIPRIKSYDIDVDVTSGDVLKIEFKGASSFGHTCLGDPRFINAPGLVEEIALTIGINSRKENVTDLKFDSVWKATVFVGGMDEQSAYDLFNSEAIQIKEYGVFYGISESAVQRWAFLANDPTLVMSLRKIVFDSGDDITIFTSYGFRLRNCVTGASRAAMFYIEYVFDGIKYIATSNIDTVN